MKMLILLIVSTFFVASCGSKKKMDDSAKGAEKTMEAAKDDAKKGKDTAASNMTGDKVSCMMKNDKRNIQVRSVGKGCELAYEKFGNEEIVATSLSGTEHCQKIADRIQGNLENAGFKCQ